MLHHIMPKNICQVPEISIEKHAKLRDNGIFWVSALKNLVKLNNDPKYESSSCGYNWKPCKVLKHNMCVC